MKDLMVFENKKVEVFELNGQVLFNPYHCGECLDLAESSVRNHLATMNSKQAVTIKNSDVHIKDFRKLNNAGEKFLTESGVYKLIFKSKKDQAEKFQDWVTDEVLPSIRKHGMYATEELLDNPDLLIAAATKLKEERAARLEAERINELNKPKVIFAEAVEISKTSILVGELAKLLKQNGVDTGEKRLFDWLRKNGYLINRKGTDYNMPTQKSAELKIIEIKETPIIHNDGHVTVSKTPKITGKGQVYFINKFKESVN